MSFVAFLVKIKSGTINTTTYGIRPTMDGANPSSRHALLEALPTELQDMILNCVSFKNSLHYLNNETDTYTRCT